jgi:uncharacterized membrane protein YbhN (UPF0104 family)
VLARSTIALTILTNAPSLLMLGGLGLTLWLGWPRGPHGALLTLPAAGIALVIMAAMWVLGGESGTGTLTRDRQPRADRDRLVAVAAHLREGASEARRLLTGGDWKLAGAIGYYAFDNAVLWAAFHAYGRAPAMSVIAMGYLVGSIGSVVPLPGGIGAVEGGLIGALVLYGAPAGPAAGAVLVYRGISLSLQVGLGALAWAIPPAARRLRSADRQPGGARSTLPRVSGPAPASLE